MGMKISPACLTDKYICVMLLVFPLWTGFEGYGNITFWKFAFFAAVTGLWLASLAVSALAGRERPRPDRPFALLCALLLAWAALSYLVSPFSPDLMGRRYDGLLPLALYVLAGLGCAPIYPAIIHSTPEHFGAGLSQSMIGLEMSCAYIGNIAAPPLFGLIANHIDVALLPWYLLAFTLVMAVSHETVVRRCRR